MYFFHFSRVVAKASKNLEFGTNLCMDIGGFIFGLCAFGYKPTKSMDLDHSKHRIDIVCVVQIERSFTSENDVFLN